jgi:hypothetical protein
VFRFGAGSSAGSRLGVTDFVVTSSVTRLPLSPGKAQRN